MLEAGDRQPGRMLGSQTIGHRQGRHKTGGDVCHKENEARKDNAAHLGPESGQEVLCDEQVQDMNENSSNWLLILQAA